MAIELDPDGPHDHRKRLQRVWGAPGGRWGQLRGEIVAEENILNMNAINYGLIHVNQVSQ